MLSIVNVMNPREALELLSLQMAAYLVEAERSGYSEPAPLADTMERLQACGETFVGWRKGANDPLSGALSYIRVGNEVHICRLMVHPDYFRQGIATALLGFVLAQEDGSSRILVSVGARNEPARALYRKFGFAFLERREAASGLCLDTFSRTING